MDQLVKTKEAVKNLTEFLRKTNEARVPQNELAHLFGDNQDRSRCSIDVEFAFTRSPIAHRVPLYFTVPHEVTWGSICFITRPPSASFKTKVLALSEDGNEVAQRIKRVMDTKELANQLGEPVAVRAFSKSFNNFVLFNVPKYPKQLTGEFLGHQNLPVWIPKKGTFAESLSYATRTVVVSRRGHNMVVCRVGHSGLSNEAIVENIEALVEKLTRHHSGAPIGDVLHIRVAATNLDGVRAKLPIYGQKIDLNREVTVPAPRKSLRGKRPLKRDEKKGGEKKRKVEA
ncbi:Ribosomal protein L1p/L10e family, putative [Angomonas deanei]|uniref:Ribosomal protein L1p/L10e family, putative n=1 Tax=Angomonas deanei TaxID=59799 RepID=A0A7G2C2A2_9TRYP|nr:Ribosomal protein L1p/L10e family, putative [Angomonas deanei]